MTMTTAGLTPDCNDDYKDPKQNWELDHDWEYFGISYSDIVQKNCLTYKCSQCECFYRGEATNYYKTDNYDQVYGFRPKDSGCRILWELEKLREKNKKLIEELDRFKSILKSFGNLIKNET